MDANRSPRTRDTETAKEAERGQELLESMKLHEYSQFDRWLTSAPLRARGERGCINGWVTTLPLVGQPLPDIILSY